jgi:hypothetical protein
MTPTTAIYVENEGGYQKKLRHRITLTFGLVNLVLSAMPKKTLLKRILVVFFM